MTEREKQIAEAVKAAAIAVVRKLREDGECDLRSAIYGIGAIDVAELVRETTTVKTEVVR